MSNVKWIECRQCDSPEFLKVFTLLEKPDNAVISICGLGFFEFKINGKKVTEDYFVPGWSDYEKRDLSTLIYPIKDDFTHRIYYMEYDVEKYLEKGKNELTVVLGNGWYNQTCRNVEGILNYGTPKLAFDLVIDSELHIVSDEEITASESQVVFNNIYYGEKQDFRIKKDYKYKVTLTQKPDAEFTKQTAPADRIHRVIVPERIATINGKDIYDCKENISGWATFSVSGASGNITTVRYSEEFDGKALDYSSAGGEEQIQSDSYISNGEKNICRPKFTYHGFRYFEIEGEYQDLTVEVVYADIDVIADFKCSSEIINKVFENFIRSQSSNIHCSVPSDCPHRERLGYTGDGQLMCDLVMHSFNAKSLYEKWIRDIADCQDIKNGHVQHTAPFYGGGGGPGGWGCAVVMVPYFFYKNYKDKNVLKQYYPNMEKWIDYMISRTENNLVVREEERGWCLGDWGINGKIFLPEPFVNTYFLIKALGYMEEICDILSYDKAEITNKKSQILSAFSKDYYNEDFLMNGIQGSQAFFVDLGLGNDAMKNKINQLYKEKGVFDTGIFGTDILTRILFENGFGDTAINLIENSFKEQIEKGATTLWEFWNGAYSHNHPMYGACLKYLITEMMGIKKDNPVKIAPKPVETLKYAMTSIIIDDMKVQVSYTIKDKEIEFTVYAEGEAVFYYNNQEYILSPNKEMKFIFMKNGI